ncbi:lasso peptide biosynthesis PqqD family chaperone [Streptomyces sp. MB09-01]|uniref:lasso peptide biosynthesis PqqD family chaperone n=1 Tax=Streptomyces sp. MB09-01 TaxID=3028666 RepID=UPI0029A95913|nr:lasso peptide biosynthesis PqqD family chaperone [Streptomyces sp. MB09-01]MDX3532898.1 lasso peptide biosynthesis PqqD family chaperone [Streptomyces sp. MB09-01]
MRLRDEVSLVDTDYGKILLDGRTGAYWELNPTGSYVLSALLGGADPDGIAAGLSAEFEVDEERAKSDVAGLVRALRDARLVSR